MISKNNQEFWKMLFCGCLRWFRSLLPLGNPKSSSTAISKMSWIRKVLTYIDVNRSRTRGKKLLWCLGIRLQIKKWGGVVSCTILCKSAGKVLLVLLIRQEFAQLSQPRQHFHHSHFLSVGEASQQGIDDDQITAAPGCSDSLLLHGVPAWWE